MSETGYRCFQVWDSQERYGRTVGDDRMAVEDETRMSSCEVFGLYFIRNGKSKLVFWEGVNIFFSTRIICLIHHCAQQLAARQTARSEGNYIIC